MNPGGMSELGATFLDALVASLAKASDYNRNHMAAPAVVLRTDAGQTLIVPFVRVAPSVRTLPSLCCTKALAM